MIPTSFDYARATSLDDALAKLGAAGDGAKLVAGGHSLIPLMKLRLSEPKMLVDIGQLKDLMKQQTKCAVHGHECHEGMFARSLYLGQRIPLAGVAHQNGTIRFGDDPKTSALDRNCRAHEVDNLYVVDSSFFPSSGAVNPALTIMANALRVGDQILKRLR